MINLDTLRKIVLCYHPELTEKGEDIVLKQIKSQLEMEALNRARNFNKK